MNVTFSTSSSSHVLPPHTAKEAVQEFQKVPEHAFGSVNDALNTKPSHPDRAYYFFRGLGYRDNDGAQPLEVARVEHDGREVKIVFDSFDFDLKMGTYTYSSTYRYDAKKNDWIEQPRPHFVDPKDNWFNLEDLRDTYGSGKEIPSNRIDAIYTLHDQILEQDDCLYNQNDFNTNAEAALSMIQDVENAPPHSFTVLGDDQTPNHYRLYFTTGDGTPVLKDLTISEHAQFQTEDRSFASLDQMKQHYQLRYPLSSNECAPPSDDDESMQ